MYVKCEDLVAPLLPAVADIFNLPCTISATADFERISFENMQLSTQGSERQKKDILKCSLRFEKLLLERKQTCSDMNDTEILADLVAKYNTFKANSAVKRWQISADAHQAIHGIIVGMSDEARALIRAHLDYNKWEESGHSTKQTIHANCPPQKTWFYKCLLWLYQCLSLLSKLGFLTISTLKHKFFSGYNESILRLKRHQLNETVKGCTPFWQQLLSDSLI